MKTPTQTDLVFLALASRTRRKMMDLAKKSPGCCVNDLCEHFEMSRIGVMKHLQILVDAKLIISRKSGRTRELFFNAAPIQMIYDRWTDEYSAFWVTQAVDLKYKVESQPKKRRPAKRDSPTTKSPTRSRTARNLKDRQAKKKLSQGKTKVKK